MRARVDVDLDWDGERMRYVHCALSPLHFSSSLSLICSLTRSVAGRAVRLAECLDWIRLSSILCARSCSLLHASQGLSERVEGLHDYGICRRCGVFGDVGPGYGVGGIGGSEGAQA